MEISKFIYLFITLVSFCVAAVVLKTVLKSHFFSSVEFRRKHGILSVPDEVLDYHRENYQEPIASSCRTKEQAYHAFILDFLDMETGIHGDVKNYVSLRTRLMCKAKSLVDQSSKK